VRVALGVAGAGTALALVAGCGSSGGSTNRVATATPTGPVAAHVGALEIVHPYLPDPASPSVAAVYLTVRNTGATPDRLVSVSSPAAAASMLMTEDDHGDTGTMAPLQGLAVPAHGQASLVPGADHLMLEQPSRLRVGEHVAVTLRFRRAGTVTVEIPVVPLTAIIDNDGSPVTTTMGHMPGMDMGAAEPSS
jgi:copper(I)-binding protein